MKRRALSVVVCCVLLLRVSAVAQSAAAADPVSGDWGTDGAARLALKFDGKTTVSGTAIWSGDGQERRTPIRTGTFNVKTGALKLEGEGVRPDGVTATYVIEGTVDGEKMSGTFSFGDRKGTFAFTRLASARR